MASLSPFPGSLHPRSAPPSSAPPRPPSALHLRRRRAHRRLWFPVRAEKQEEGGRRGPVREEGDEVAELESALGIETKTVRRNSVNKDASQRRGLSVFDVIEEQIRKNEADAPPESPLVGRIRGVGDWLIDKTENTGGQDNVVILAFVVFPVWFLALLVTSGVLKLPFDLPFLHH